MDHLFPYPKMGHSWLEILEDPLTRKLLGHDAVHAEKTAFLAGVTSRLTFLLNDATKHLSFLKIGYTSLEAFLQANATGPPLDFDSVPVIFPSVYHDETRGLKEEMLRSLTVDGEAVYAHTPRIELFWLAKIVMSNATLAEVGFNGRRARMRVNFWHQKLLSAKSESLQEQLYHDASVLEGQLYARYKTKSAASEEHLIEFLTERAAIRTFYGDDGLARTDLERAANIRNFKFALTGILGKRTKFQHQDVSQLVVLAKSRDFEPEPYSSRKSSRAEPSSSRKSSLADSGIRTAALRSKSPANLGVRRTSATSVFSASSEFERPVSPLSGKPVLQISPVSAQPENLLLNDDTVLEKIAFQKPSESQSRLDSVSDEQSLPPELASLDPSDQPLLFPMDSIILLSTASSISNEKPEDGLTREETLPYATRVLDGGSSNWQVYTQALLVRSRIEGYKSRTMERGLLQLQALVDQVIAETSGDTSATSKSQITENPDVSAPSTFLPKLQASESASVAERLKYIYQISPPLRWELEAELAQRWTQLGGLKSALEIYQRLQMKAEVALCLAATDQEAEAVKLLQSMLFDNPDASDTASRKLLKPPPNDAPRLLSILGDIEQNPNYYMLAWTVSNKRYVRAQRSLGRYYMKHKDFKRAAEAYSAAVGVTRLDSSTWFALGCTQFQLEDWPGAVESFTRVIQLDEQDGEAWSNLAIALLRLPPPTAVGATMTTISPTSTSANTAAGTRVDDEEEPNTSSTQHRALDPLQHTREALRALQKAAQLKREDARIWDNYLTVAASIPPSQGTPWNEIVHAMSRVIELRRAKEGESAIDLKVLEVLVRYVTENYDYPTSQDESSIDVAVDDNNNHNQKNASADQSQIESTDTDTKSKSKTNTKADTLPFLARSLLNLTDTQLSALATTPQLFTILSQISKWRNRPYESLSYVEKSWRATTASTYETQQNWNSIVQSTLALVEAYTTLGPLERERTGGPVEKSWKFKSKSCVKSVLSKGVVAGWEGSEGWVMLKERLEQLT